MEGYIKSHLMFPFITCVFAAVVVFVFRDWSPHKTTLILSTACIAISVALILIKYSSFSRSRRHKDALILNICLAQIISGVIAIIAVIAEGSVDIRFAKFIYVFILSVVLLIAGNMSIFGGGSLFVIILSSAALYWIPALKSMFLNSG